MGLLCNLVVAVLAIVVGYTGLLGAQWFFTDSPRCPLPSDIQTEYVKANFDPWKFQGVWYELAYHDYTQPSSLCGCERSVKHYHPDTDHIFDNFTLFCSGDHYYNNLTHNMAGKDRGIMMGYWPFLPMILFPNTIVALGVDEKTDKYNWVIEFQCLEYFSRVVFTGINFYHKQRSVPEAELQLMMDTARKQGLGYWMDHGLKMYIVDHTDCTYPPVEERLIKLFNEL